MTDDDVDLHEWVDKLEKEELRGVIKYLVLLNAEAVQNAMNYTLQQQQNRERREQQEDEEEEPPPPPLNRLVRSNTDDVVDDALPTPTKKSHLRPSGKMNFTPNPLVSSTDNQNLSLIVLCTMKPATKQDAIDQDEAMALCKRIGIVPYIVLAESKPEKLSQLLSISNAISIFPQFFLSHASSTEGKIEFLGTYETILAWNQQGVLTCNEDLVQLAKNASPPPPNKPKQLHFQEESEKNTMMTNSPTTNTSSSNIHHHHHHHHLHHRLDDEDEIENSKPPRQSLEPPEEKDVLSQSYSHNRRAEPPAKSPPKSTQKLVQMTDVASVPPPPTPNLNSNTNNNNNNNNNRYDEPPAQTPPKTTTKAQRQSRHIDEIDGNHHNKKPEPTPGGVGMRPDLLEPPTEYKQQAATATPSLQSAKLQNEEYQYHQSPETPATPGWMSKLQQPQGDGQPTSPAAEEQQVDNQVLSLLNGVGACYLILNSSNDNNSTSLNIYYSESPMQNAVGVWTAPDILDFKQVQNLSELEFIGNCASDCDINPINYYKGWSQFIKAARSMNGTVIKLVNQEGGKPVDFYLYSNNGGNPTCEKVPGIQFDTADLDAVACLPQGVPFDYTTLRGRKWSKEAKKLGSVAMFNSLVHNVGATTTTAAAAAATNSSSKKSDTSPPRQSSSSTEKSSKSKATTAPPPAEVAAPVPPSSPEALQTNPTDEERGFGGGTSPASLSAAGVPQQEDDIPDVDDDDDSIPPPPELEKEAKDDQSPSVPPPTTETVYETAMDAPSPKNGACYLVYEPGSSGRLVEYYSRTPVEGAIGRWVPGNGKKIAGFKFKQNLGRTVLIGNCSGGVQGRKNYCSGWNQFVRSAKIYMGDVMLWDPAEGVKGMPVDVWLYNNDSRPGYQSQKLPIGVATNVENILAVCTIPKNTRFYEGISVDLLKWLADGSNYGASSKFE